MSINRPDNTKNPKRVAAGTLNRLKRKGITEPGRAKLRQVALTNRPWEHTTGPRTPEGKAKVAMNGLARCTGRQSIRAIHRELADVRALLKSSRCLRGSAVEKIPDVDDVPQTW